MSSHALRPLLIALASASAAGGCALPPWIGHRPVFPAGGPSSWTIPLYEPLRSIGPRVTAIVCGAARADRPRACEPVLLYVDSGSSHSALPAATFARLGVETTSSRFATIEDAAGDRRAWAGGLVPEMRLGDRLALSDVVASVYDRTPILGADVLTAHGWHVDVDRGVLLLGVDENAAHAASVRVPVRGLPERTIVDLSVQGKSVPLLLDTGAPITVVAVSELRALGLPIRRLTFGWPLSERDPNLRISEATDAILRLGDLELGRRQLVAHPQMAGGPSRGMLGIDVLSDYAFGVSASTLELQPRPPTPLASTGERIARWRDLPSCPALPGCVAAALESGTDAGLRARLRITAAPPRAQRYLFGCLDREGALLPLPIWIEIGVRSPAAGRVLVVPLEVPEALRQVWARGCASLALLDINPVLADVRPLTADVEARLAMGLRRARLD